MGEVAAAGVTSAGNIAATELTNQANAQQAQNAMGFSERMSNTAYQRSTADMKAAGINPLMAYSQGGASSPMGVSANMQSPDIGKVGESLISTAFEKKRVDAELANKNSSTTLNSAAAMTELERAKKEASSAKSEALIAQALEANQPAKLTEAKTRMKAAKADLDHATLTNITRKIGENLGNINPLKGVINIGGGQGRQDVH
ncbi:MAG: DNA pilot protein [Arizlama microvirus]|nr:MAG: DNA pilot protein [Arizlama microvirus]